MELPQSNTLLPVCSYTRTELLSLRTKTSLLSLSTVDRLKDLIIGYHLVVVVVVDPTPPTCCQQSPAPEIMWQPAVSPPRWQGKAPLCRDSSRGPG